MRGPVEFISPVWLSHHRSGEEDRCVRVGNRSLCRRCLWLWPLTFAAMVVSATVGLWPTDLDELFLTVLPLPAVIEFLAEVRGRVRYDARRQIATAVPLSLALGRGLARYLEDPGDALFWQMVLIYGGICGFVALRALVQADR